MGGTRSFPLIGKLLGGVGIAGLLLASNVTLASADDSDMKAAMAPRTPMEQVVPAESDTSKCSVKVVTQADADSTMTGTPCDDLIVATDSTNDIDAGFGNDVIVGGAGVETIDAGPGEDLVFSNGAKVIFGGSDNDRLEGGSPADAQNLSKLEEETLAPFIEKFGEAKVTAALNSGASADFASTPGCSDAPYFASTQFGGFGNDTLNGTSDSDYLSGGIGDDTINAGACDDFLSGGQGGDTLVGGTGSDWTRGDGTQDTFTESTTPGANDVDTLSFASGVTPGFPGPDPTGINNFPTSSDGYGRGVYLDIPDKPGPGANTTQVADNGAALDAGGNDLLGTATDMSNYETFIGTPFADYIIGSNRNDTIYGGGGADVIRGEGGDDFISGGAAGDNIDGGPDTGTGGADNDVIDGDASFDHCVSAGTISNCNEPPYGTLTGYVVPSPSNQVAVGYQTEVHNNASDQPFVELFVRGSTGDDNVTATYVDPGGANDWIEFTLSSGTFDTSGLEVTSGCDYSQATATPTPKITCYLQDDLTVDSIVMAGMEGNDTFTAAGSQFPTETSLTLLGGPGNDYLSGTSSTYDQLVDGPGDDDLHGAGLDDGLINTAGRDRLYGEGGDDLLLSAELCQYNDVIDGGTYVGGNNASWLQTSGPKGVNVDLPTSKYGEYTPGVSSPSCPNGTIGTINSIQNLEGSWFRDKLTGGGADNNIIGWLGNDYLTGNSGNDNMIGFGPGSISSVSSGGVEDDQIYAGPNNDIVAVYDGRAENHVDCGTDDGTGLRDRGNKDYSGLDNSQIQANCENIVAGP